MMLLRAGFLADVITVLRSIWVVESEVKKVAVAVLVAGAESAARSH